MTNGRNKINILHASAIALMLVVTSVGVGPQKAEAALAAVGPLSTVHGFPTYFQDAQGLALQPCLGINPDGTGLADPNCVVLGDVGFKVASPISFPNNFPGESFTYIADADVLPIGTVGAKAAFRIALENAFTSTVAGADKQIVFARIGMKVSKVNGTNGLAPNSSYTVNHPLGTFTCTTDLLGDIIGCIDPKGNGNGGAQEYRVEDGVFTPPVTQATIISTLLPTPITGLTTFLKAAVPAPPTGYIGNPNILQTMEPGPGGAAFTITGPDAGGPGIDTASTDMWNIAGKIATIDTVSPTIGSTNPVVVPLDGAANINFPANVNVTDDLGIFTATIDLGPLGDNFLATINGIGAGTPSPATGSGTFIIDTKANKLTFDINVAGLTGGGETGAYINGPLQTSFSLPLGSSKSGVWNYPEAIENDILVGNMSVRIHTILFPTGEVAGPIVAAKNVQNMIRTAGTITSGTWSAVVPSATRIGTFDLPIVVSDGSNTTHGVMTLSVVHPLAGVDVTPMATSVPLGATQQLVAAPINTIGEPFIGGVTVWSSSDNAIATVDTTGMVAGVATGTAVITASVTGAGKTVTGTSTITVVDAPPMCQTGADMNGDGAISNLEILNYVRSWKSGNVVSLLLLKAISFWKAGTGC